MEEFLGRKLKRNEIVHHINKDKSGNRIKNLQLMSLSEHSKMHMKDSRMSQVTKDKLAKASTGKINSRRKLTKEQIIKIKELSAMGISGIKISITFDVSKWVIQRILRGETYKKLN